VYQVQAASNMNFSPPSASMHSLSLREHRHLHLVAFHACLQMNSTSFGHYVSFVRACDSDSSNGSSQGQWYVCDDSRVARTRASDVLSQNAYMLFYQRDTPRPAPQPGYLRPTPLLPLTMAQRAAATAAAAPTTPKAQEAAVKANGLVPAAAAGDEEAEEQAVPDTLHLDQHQLQQELLQAARDMLQERQQQQEQQQQQPRQRLTRAARTTRPLAAWSRLAPRRCVLWCARMLCGGRVRACARPAPLHPGPDACEWCAAACARHHLCLHRQGAGPAPGAGSCVSVCA
jgi:hypothetical protein